MCKELFREYIKIHNYMLQLKCCSMQQLCIGFPIQIMNMGVQPLNFEIYHYSVVL